MLLLVMFAVFSTVSGQMDCFWEQRGYPPILRGSSAVSASFGTGVVSQRLDNTKWFSRKNFNMRYMYNDALYDGTGPIFIMVGGEFNMYQAANYLSDGLMYTLAQQFKAYMFLTEHRFYGESVPDGDLRKKNLFYLGVRQVLGDLVNFIKTIKRENSAISGCKDRVNWAEVIKKCKTI